MPRVGLTTGPGQIDQWQIVGERDQPMPGEHRLERRDVAHDVDYRQRSPRTRRHRRRGLEDLQQRIEPALGIGAWQQRRRRIGTVQFGAGGDVGPELGFHEAFEDADHLRRLERPPTAGPQVDTTVDLVQPGGAVDVIGLGVIEGAVGVGKVLPPAHHRAEVLERQMLGLVEQQFDHLDQPVRHTVGCCAPGRVRSPGRGRCDPPATPRPPPGTTRTRATTRRMVDTSSPDQLALARIHPLIERCPSSPYTPRASATATTAMVSASIRRRSNSNSRNRSVIESLSSPINSSTRSLYMIDIVSNICSIGNSVE